MSSTVGNRMTAGQRAVAVYAAAQWADNEGDAMPTLYRALDIFAYHIGAIMSNPDRVRVHFYGDVTGDYTFKRNAVAISDRDGAYVDGLCIGNRCAARNDYAERCAPVLAQIAKANR